MVSIFTASFSLFVLFSTTISIDGIAAQQKPLSCASSLPPGNEPCEGGFCFDLLDVQSDSIKSGCTHSAAKCPSNGCFLLPNAQKFLCCCSHPFCNGKSPKLVKGRWRMYLKGDYPAKTLRKSPRDVSREMPEEHGDSGLRVVDQMKNGNLTTKTTTNRATTTVAKVTTILTKKPTSSSPRTTIMTTTKKVEKKTVKTTTIKQNTTTPRPARNETANTPTTRSPPKTTPKATIKLASNLTEFIGNKLNEQIAEKGLEILEFLGNGTTKKADEKMMDKVEKEMPKKTTAKVTMDKGTTTMSPSPSIQPSSTMTTKSAASPKQSTTSLGPSEGTTKASNATTIAPKTNSPSTPSKLPISLPPKLPTQSAHSEPVTFYSTSKRTTRSPTPQPSTTIRTTLGPWEPAVPSFPWYFIALAGFLSSSAVFLLVYWTVKGCRRIFQKRMRNGRRSGEEGGQLGEPMIPMGNGQNLDGKKEGKTTAKKESRPKKRAVPKANGQMMMSSKTTNESLMSQCTASTGVGEQKIPEIDMEYGGGEQVTVIDPLLNQQYNGTMNK